MKITHLRVYKPDGNVLEFEVGTNTKEGAIDEICLILKDGIPTHPVVRYKIQKGKSVAVEAHLVGFPYSYRLE